jgi:hypothetical protein
MDGGVCTVSATTPKGYPYPVGTDPMSDGDLVLNQLATGIDTRLGALASGSVTFTRFASTNPDAATVTLPVGRFLAGVPVHTQASAVSTGPSSCRVGTNPVSNTSFTLLAWRESGTGDLTVMWVAAQQV